MDYIAIARSSYFEVNDEEALKALASGFYAHAAQKGNKWALMEIGIIK